MGYFTGQIQSLHGLCQQTNSECEYMLTLAWVRTCLIVHSLATSHEDHEYESDFWEWVDEGRMKGRTTDLLKALPGVGQNHHSQGRQKCDRRADMYKKPSLMDCIEFF